MHGDYVPSAMQRIVDITTDGLHLAAHRGFLTVSASGEEKGRVALDDIGALIVHAHGTTWSNSVLVRLSERAVPIVVCGPNHAPVACVWPLEGHHAQSARMRAQLSAPRPLAKQLWRQIVAGKIRMQGEALAACDKEGGAFEYLARKVRSGDPENVEAQAARRYWKAMFGPEFVRDKRAEGANGLLNYGYTVLRAIISRSICASGLHPTVGVFHANRMNAFALSDDLMEPFRPMVDLLVGRLLSEGVTDVQPATKGRLATIQSLDVAAFDGTVSPLGIAAQRLAHSLATSFETGIAALDLPARPVQAACGEQT
jgi:CRISP-associated protein Cas1